VLWGNNLNLAYEFTKGQQIYWKNLYTVNSDKTVRDASGKDYIANISDFNSITNIFTSRQLFNTTFGGDHAINFSNSRPWKLEWQYNLSQAKRDEPNLNSQTWRRSIDTLNNYNRLGNNPDGSRFYSSSEDNVRNPSFKLEIPFNQWDGLKSILKVGHSMVDREKNFLFREFGYKSSVSQNTSIDSFNQGLATLYPVPGELTFSPFLSITGAKVFSERQVEPNAYNAFQKLNATFMQVDMPIYHKVRFIGGVRYEDSYQKVKTYVTRDSYSSSNLSYGCDFSDFSNSEAVRVYAINNKVCNTTNNGIGEIRTKDRLPMANFVYEASEKVNLRLSYSETLTRPDLRELSSFGFSPYYGADRIFGNSDLRRTYIHNYDFRWEYYGKGSEYMGIGVFNKNLSNPIEMIGQPVSGSITARFTYANADSAYIRGLEFDFRREFLNLFRVESNFFFINSRVNVLDYAKSVAIQTGLVNINDRAATYDPTNLSRPLQGQSPFVFNLKYDWFLTKAKNATLGLYYNYFGDRIYAVGANGTPDAYEKGIGYTDLVLQYKHQENYDFKLAV
jgi:outer membrane receptor protein involved in Fe transport